MLNIFGNIYIFDLKKVDLSEELSKVGQKQDLINYCQQIETSIHPDIKQYSIREGKWTNLFIDDENIMIFGSHENKRAVLKLEKRNVKPTEEDESNPNLN